MEICEKDKDNGVICKDKQRGLKQLSLNICIYLCNTK